MTQNKITPALWFHTKDGKMNHISDYYQNIFGGSFTTGSIIPLGETPSGYAEMSNCSFFGNMYMLMTTSKEHHPFNDAFAIIINCDDQNEIDKYWNYFTQEGKESMCGWCQDKFGLRWQIIPKNMGELMSKPTSGEIMMKQTKIIIAEYLK